MRDVQGKAALVVGGLYLVFVGWSLWGAVRPIETYLFRIVHLAFILVLGFLTYSYSAKAPGSTKWIDEVFINIPG